MSIGDLNNDKLNDLVIIDATGTQATVYYFDDSLGTYAHSAIINLNLPTNYTCDGVISTAIPTELQDLIFVCSLVDGTSGDVTETKLFYYQQSVSQTSSSSSTNKYSWAKLDSTFSDVSLYPGSHPLALDVNGDQAMDLLYQSADKGLQVALGSRTATETYTPKDFFSNFVLTNTDNTDCKSPNTEDIISLPNSNAFVDLNGDCVPDLLLTRQTAGSLTDTSSTVSTYYEIY